MKLERLNSALYVASLKVSNHVDRKVLRRFPINATNETQAKLKFQLSVLPQLKNNAMRRDSYLIWCKKCEECVKINEMLYGVFPRLLPAELEKLLVEFDDESNFIGEDKNH